MRVRTQHLPVLASTRKKFSCRLNHTWMQVYTWMKVCVYHSPQKAVHWQGLRIALAHPLRRVLHLPLRNQAIRRTLRRPPSRRVLHLPLSNQALRRPRPRLKVANGSLLGSFW